MSPEQLSQTITQLGLSAIFLFMLFKLWQRHTQMTDRMIDILLSEIKAERGENAEKLDGDKT